jgi:hypothetical protein
MAEYENGKNSREEQEIVLCSLCSKPEYAAEQRRILGGLVCRTCYRNIFEDIVEDSYRVHDLDGLRPTMEEYEAQHKSEE